MSLNAVPDTGDRDMNRWATMAILAGVLARLAYIEQPFVDAWSWRQADMAMIARHFFHEGLAIAWPRIDWVGDAPGYVGTEFPLLPAAAALGYHVVGTHEWVARVLSVVAFAAAAAMLYSLIARVNDRRTAAWGIAAFSAMPLSIMSGRSFMSDMTALAFALGAIINIWRWLEDPASTSRAIGAALALSLAVLVKPTLAVIGVPLVYLVLAIRGASAFTNPRLWLVAIAALTPPALWYWHALFVARTFPPFHMFGDGGIGVVSVRQYLDRLNTFVLDGTTVVLAGVALAGAFVAFPRDRPRYLFHWWAVSCVFFTVVAGVGTRHPWYQLPTLIPVAAWVGAACGRLTSWQSRAAKPMVACVLLLAAAESWHALRPSYVSWAEPLRRAGMAVRELTPSDARVVFIDQGDPSGLYYTERRGWHFLALAGSIPDTSAEAIASLEDLRRRGASVLVATRYTTWWIDEFPRFGDHVRRNYPELAKTPDYTIWNLRPGGQ